MKLVRKCLVFAVIALLASIPLAALGGCGNGGGSGKVTVLCFSTEGNESAKEFKPVLDEAKKKYADDVVFENIDMDDPENKDKIEEYHVTMDPTYLILNSEGKVKQTFMGKPHEEMFNSAIAGLLPRKEGTPSSAPADSAPVPPTSDPAPGPAIPGVPPQ